ncbi:MAG: hypothetical protein JW940_16045 [Polyangiaceae bacterium]|nr:hypothetical protein [Polyangiaceae bacterium]
MMMRPGIVLYALAALLSTHAATASGLGGALWAEHVAKRPRIDGLLQDWNTQFTPLGQTLRGAIKSGQPRARGAVGYDDDNLYVALEVTDDKLVSTGAAGESDDHAILLIAFPNTRGGYRMRQLQLYPGHPGKRAGRVKLDGGPVAGSKIVEAPDDEGFTLEASIPWRAFPEARRVRVGLRGALRYADADSGKGVQVVIGTSRETSGKAMPPILSEPEQGLYVSLIQPKGLPATPTFQRFGAVSGSPLLERVAVFGGFLTIAGPGYRGGSEFYYAELGTRNGSDVSRLELCDFDGDGHQEILLIKRLGVGSEYQDILQVLKVGSEGEPAEVFRHEVGFSTADGKVSNKVLIGHKGGRATLTIAQGESSGFETVGAPESVGVKPSLRPWETIERRTYEWSGGTLAQSAQKSWKPKRSAPTAPAAGSSLSAATETSGTGPGAYQAPPAPRPPNNDELLEPVYVAYRKDRGSGRSEAAYDFVTDVVGDETVERVLVHGRDLVVFGERFRGGKTYAYAGLGVASSEDVKNVAARDLTGDGKAEILVYAVLRSDKADRTEDQPQTQALIVYRVTGSGIQRIFAAETGRSLGKSRVIGALAFVPSSNDALAIEVRPGLGVGFTREDNPFRDDRAEGLEPVILPWSKRKVVFTFDGREYKRK